MLVVDAIDFAAREILDPRPAVGRVGRCAQDT
jgi:hypothetical protein